MKLIYVGDPMCSWCYGFGKEMTALVEQHPGLELEIVVGGVRAGATDILDDEGKQFRLGHWERVEANSGLPFNRKALLARENFVYDTEPICRAVVSARRLAPQAKLLAVFRALQHAFYVDGLDTTNGRVLSEVAVASLKADGYEIEVEGFHAEWRSDAAIGETRADFKRARLLGVRSFPSLLLDTGKGIVEVSPGYAHAKLLDMRLRAAMDKYAEAKAAA
jgi:putative protein-disulfide isomerase